MRMILSILLLSVCYSQDCGEGYIWNNETIIYGGLSGCHFSKNSNCFYQSDLDVLQDIIDLNESLSGEEPLKIGCQHWLDGRLELLNLFIIPTDPLLFSCQNNVIQIDFLPESIGNWDSLKYLNLYGNQLTSLPERIGELSNLKNLSINFNKLTSIPESMGNLSSLENLELNENQLTYLPNSIWSLVSLKYLSLQNNQLTSLPESICNLTNLLTNLNTATIIPFCMFKTTNFFRNNKLCPPYPSCIEDIGYQNTLECCDGEGLLEGSCDCDANVLDECSVCGGDGPAEGFNCNGEPLSLFNGLIPKEFTIHNIYPNPFNPITNITYGIPEYTNVQILVYDLSGKQVETLIDQFQTPGYHSVNWNADNHPSGVYFVKIVAGDYINTQKLILVK